MHSSDERARWLARHVLPHEPMLRAWLVRRPTEGLDVDDIVQETYARLSSVTSVEGISNCRNYMFRTAQSVILTHLRRARVVTMHSFAQVDGEGFVCSAPDPETVASDRDELTRLGEAIARLPRRMREVFVLRRVEGLSQKEVAARLGVSEGTVEKHMASSFRRLADLFGRGGNRAPRASGEGTERIDRPNAAGDKSGD
jgi:RNA polymerase sigma-70 factor (ECF subfamily)